MYSRKTKIRFISGKVSAKYIARIFSMVLLIMAFFLLPISSSAETKEKIDADIAAIPDIWPEAPDIVAKSAILLDAASGEILYAKDATEKAFPASTTKLVTALLTLENASTEDIVSFSSRAVNIPAGSSHIGMRRNEKMNLLECLYGLLLPSANEVANALAEHVDENITAFVQRMNNRVAELGGVNTSFTNANGLHNDNHYTCAYDLALVMRECVKNSLFVKIASSLSYVHHADDLLPKDIPMTNTNQMIRSTSPYYDENVVCGKTGHTVESGYNLVMYAERDGVRLISVVIGCRDGEQYVATERLLNYGFSSFNLVLPAELDESLIMNSNYTFSPLKIPTVSPKLFTMQETDTILLPENITFEMLTKEVSEVANGKRLTYYYKDYPVGSVVLYNNAGKSEMNILTKEEAATHGEALPNLVTIDAWFLLLLGGIVLAGFFLFYIMKQYILPKK